MPNFFGSSVENADNDGEPFSSWRKVALKFPNLFGRKAPHFTWSYLTHNLSPWEVTAVKGRRSEMAWYVFPKHDIKGCQLTGSVNVDNWPTLCVVMVRRHSLERICWTEANRAGSRGSNQAYWKTAKATRRRSPPPPASWTHHQARCSLPQWLLFPPGQQQDVRIYWYSSDQAMQRWPDSVQ